MNFTSEQKHAFLNWLDSLKNNFEFQKIFFFFKFKQIYGSIFGILYVIIITLKL